MHVRNSVLRKCGVWRGGLENGACGVGIKARGCGGVVSLPIDFHAVI